MVVTQVVSTGGELTQIPPAQDLSTEAVEETPESRMEPDGSPILRKEE